MEKVKLTESQADALIKGIADYGSDGVLLDRYTGGGSSVLGNMSPVTLAKALYIGYEVEPEFKPGDEVVWEYDEHNIKYGTVDHIDGKGRVWVKVGAEISWLGNESLRHLTEDDREKIATEKQSRFFAENGRKHWELQDHDLLVNEFDELCEVAYSDIKEREYFIKNIKHDDGGVINWGDLDKLRKYRIRYFAEDRKDI